MFGAFVIEFLLGMAPVQVHAGSSEDIEYALAALETTHLPDFLYAFALFVHPDYLVVAVALGLADGARVLACLELGFVLVRLTECHGFRRQRRKHIHEVG